MRRGPYVITLFLLVFTSWKGFGQTSFEPLNRAKIEQETNDVSLRSFYPNLIDRYNSFDSTLSLEDYRNLYYGFVFQNEYSAMADHRKAEMANAMGDNKYAEVIRICDEVLAKIPISLAANYYRAYAMMNSNENDLSYLKYARRYKGLAAAIISSGDGKGCKTGFKTIFVEDEYEIMFNFYEIDINTNRTFQYPCDRFAVSPSGTYPYTEIFFDVTESLSSMKKAASVPDSTNTK